MHNISCLLSDNVETVGFWEQIGAPEEGSGLVLILFSAICDYTQKAFASPVRNNIEGLKALFANKPSIKAWYYGEVSESVLSTAQFWEHLCCLASHGSCSSLFLKECLQGEQVKCRLSVANVEEAATFLKVALLRKINEQALALFLSALVPSTLKALQDSGEMLALFESNNKADVLLDPTQSNRLVIDDMQMAQVDAQIREALKKLAACFTREGMVVSGKTLEISRLLEQQQAESTFWQYLAMPEEESSPVLIPLSAMRDYIQKAFINFNNREGLRALFANKPSIKAWYYGEVSESVLSTAQFWEHLCCLASNANSGSFLRECLQGEQVKCRLSVANVEEAATFLKVALLGRLNKQALALFLSALVPSTLKALQDSGKMLALFKSKNKADVLLDPIQFTMQSNRLVIDDMQMAQVDDAQIREALKKLAACFTREGVVANGKILEISRLLVQQQVESTFWQYLAMPEEESSPVLIPLSAMRDYTQKAFTNTNNTEGLKALFANKPSIKAWYYGEVSESVLSTAQFWEHLCCLASHGSRSLFLKECLQGELVKSRLNNATLGQTITFLKAVLPRRSVSGTMLALFLSTLKSTMLRAIEKSGEMQIWFKQNNKEHILLDPVGYLSLQTNAIQVSRTINNMELVGVEETSKKKRQYRVAMMLDESEVSVETTPKKSKQCESNSMMLFDQDLDVTTLTSEWSMAMEMDNDAPYDGLFAESEEEEAMGASNQVLYPITDSRASLFSSAPLLDASMALDFVDEDIDLLGPSQPQGGEENELSYSNTLLR